MTMFTETDPERLFTLTFDVPETESNTATYQVTTDGKTMVTTDVEPLVPKKVGCDRVDCPCRCSACRKDELWETA